MHRHRNKIAVYGICEFKEKAKPSAENKSKKNEKGRQEQRRWKLGQHTRKTRKGMQISL
jgi:hypothetical protein